MSCHKLPSASQLPLWLTQLLAMNGLLNKGFNNEKWWFNGI
jgi:hypothetical protein